MMNKSESKYFNTALRMHEALISLLEKKDFEYITVKEICEKAGVNRSTFYLHYETIADLVNEAMEQVNNRFLSYFAQGMDDFVGTINKKAPKELVLITKDYLFPYLQFIRENKNVYRAAFRNPNGTQAIVRYGNLKKFVLEPILKKFEVPNHFQKYYIAYYIEGLIAIVKEWLKNDCQDAVETIATIMEECVRPLNGAEGKIYGA